MSQRLSEVSVGTVVSVWAWPSTVSFLNKVIRDTAAVYAVFDIAYTAARWLATVR